MSAKLPTFGLLPGDWADRAACRESPFPDAWHPGENIANGAYMTDYALAVCKTCPVVLACLRFALDAEHRTCWGIWGATTQDQRAKYRRKKAAA